MSLELEEAKWVDKWAVIFKDDVSITLVYEKHPYYAIRAGTGSIMYGHKTIIAKVTHVEHLKDIQCPLMDVPKKFYHSDLIFETLDEFLDFIGDDLDEFKEIAQKIVKKKRYYQCELCDEYFCLDKDICLHVDEHIKQKRSPFIKSAYKS